MLSNNKLQVVKEVNDIISFTPTKSIKYNGIIKNDNETIVVSLSNNNIAGNIIVFNKGIGVSNEYVKVGNKKDDYLSSHLEIEEGGVMAII